MIKVTKIKRLGGYRLHATFSDGTAGEHDFSALVAETGPMGEPLRDPAYFARVFPSVPRTSRNESIFLDRNFRQRAPLARLSAGFRNFLQNDKRLDVAIDGASPAILHRYISSAAIEAMIVQRIASVDEYATVAVIAPTEQEAAQCMRASTEDLQQVGDRPRFLDARI
jgi:hypothetical protein